VGLRIVKKSAKQSDILNATNLERLLKELGYLREAIEGSPLPFVLYDTDDKLIINNEAYAELHCEAFDHYKKEIEKGTVTFAQLMRKVAPKHLEGDALDAYMEERQAHHHACDGTWDERQYSNGEWFTVAKFRMPSGTIAGFGAPISKLKRREEEIHHAYELLTDITSVVPQGIIVMDEEQIVFINENAKQQLDVPQELCQVGAPWLDVVAYQTQRGDFGQDAKTEKVIGQMRGHIKNGTTDNFEHKTSEGRTLIGSRVPNSHGGLTVTYTDITERKQKELEHHKAKEKAEEVLSLQERTANAMAQGLVVFENHAISFANQRAHEILGIPDKILSPGTTLDEFLEFHRQRGDYGSCEDDSRAYMSSIKANIEALKPHTVERQDTNGTKLRVDAVPYADGGLILTFTDITDSSRREAELTAAKEALERTVAENDRSRARFRKFAETNSDWFWEADSKLRLSYLSETYESVTGVSPGQMIGKTRRETGAPGASDEELRAHLENLEAHRPFRDFTHSTEGTDGKKIWVSISGIPVFGENDTFEGYIGSGRDVTAEVNKRRELERAHRTAEMAERAKSEFLANMSHEIRTPMNGVMGMAELLATTELDAKQKMFTDVIVKSGASLLTIINDILDFSKIDAGQLELDPDVFELTEAIEDVATLVSAKVAEKDLELIVRVDPSLPKCFLGDVGRLRQIVTNLLGNAVKFTEKGHVYLNVDGEIEGEGEDRIAHLSFKVEDTGIGIATDQCALIFDKFSQVDTSATRKHEGTGLGLAISSSLVKLMDGNIGVESQLGKGSTFWFDIALPVDGKTEHTKVIPGDLTGARILVIDDNGVNRSILSEQLAAWRFDAAAASSGAEGLQVLRAAMASGLKLDLVILDYQMPGMSGADVLSEIRNDPALQNTPVLMLTSVDGAQTSRNLNGLNLEASLTKPTRSSLLLETILQVVAEYRLNSAPELQNLSLLEQHEKSNSSQLDVLVAEDNEVNQILYRQVLEEMDLNFKIVENGRLAVAATKVHRPKLILMDVSMPEMNGKEATKEIRKRETEHSIPRTPIVGVTAHALGGDMEACIDAGMDDYLSKPVSPSKLSTKVRQWLKEPRVAHKQA